MVSDEQVNQAVAAYEAWYEQSPAVTTLDLPIMDCGRWGRHDAMRAALEAALDEPDCPTCHNKGVVMVSIHGGVGTKNGCPDCGRRMIPVNGR